jgi:ABC-type lipoprotein release transport system permease subunit
VTPRVLVRALASLVLLVLASAPLFAEIRLAPVLAGIVAGLLLAVLLVRGMVSMLFGVAPFDPLTLAAVVVLLLAAAVLACALPARRATRVDAVAALRAE